MFRRVFPVTGTASSSSGRWFVSMIMPACVLLLPAAGHPDDSYLDAISVEAEKLGDAPGGDREAEGSSAAAAADSPVIRFERELEKRYKGSYLFYKKLPVKSQEEVFREYEQGASIEDVRKTIMNRYLHSR